MYSKFHVSPVYKEKLIYSSNVEAYALIPRKLLLEKCRKQKYYLIDLNCSGKTKVHKKIKKNAVKDAIKISFGCFISDDCYGRVKVELINSTDFMCP